ncbi:hypothetical protein R1flu_014070 [Riccia fluitans]|uniref:DUF676 domain-containing protein n=1 Tax=Riccia fluitans TaxID=41844 RepID=A0ABD1YG60_9MARC
MSHQNTEEINRQAGNLEVQRQPKTFERINDGVYALKREVDPDVTLVFFHGLSQRGTNPEQAFWRTWKRRDHEDCWPESLLPELLKKEGRGYKASVLSVSYENRPDPGKDGKGTQASDEYLIVENLVNDLILNEDADVGQKGVPVILVGHDLGGILVKSFVLMVERKAHSESEEKVTRKLKNFLENLSSVFFYSTPHHGAKAFEQLAAKLKKSDANQMLRLMTILHKETARINEDFGTYRRGEQGLKKFTTYGIHAACATLEGELSIQIVAEASARNDIDDFYSGRADHFGICQEQAAITWILSNGGSSKRYESVDYQMTIQTSRLSFRKIKAERFLLFPRASK